MADTLVHNSIYHLQIGTLVSFSRYFSQNLRNNKKIPVKVGTLEFPILEAWSRPPGALPFGSASRHKQKRAQDGRTTTVCSCHHACRSVAVAIWASGLCRGMQHAPGGFCPGNFCSTARLRCDIQDHAMFLCLGSGFGGAVAWARCDVSHVCVVTLVAL